MYPVYPARVFVAAGFAAFLIVGAVTATSGFLSAETSAPIPVRWFLAHEPADVYAEAIDEFQRVLAQESDGQMALEIVMPRDIGLVEPSHAEIVAFLDEGRAEIASTYGVADGVSDNRFYAFGLPFLFKNYDDVESAFESPRAHQLLSGLSDTTTIRALAYTLSGGFRIIASPSHEIRSAEDFMGLRIATAGGSVAEETLRALGAIPVAANTVTAETADNIDAVETTYARLSSAVGSQSTYTQHISETNHTLFFTTIVVSDDFYESLTPKQRVALEAAARAAARVERTEAIALNEENKQALAEKGSVIRTMEPATREELVHKTHDVYERFRALIGEELVDALVAH
jgi:C4-dicarboxylate-binding protein DctP